ncbi:hypothetical protein GIB67_028335 [Kingdonia uniflora]|uniref:Scarecrow-like protein 28 n=1 Tax=Kingdonia uniflora TaxID=39325 RepID=A0A7J7MHQ7_9MAGN|nr:hypothetical protein GIB67_028335 [Kingdonia uniflora]
MLAGCSTLLSPRHRSRSEVPEQFKTCNYPLPSMSTQRLDIPCSFPRKEAPPRPQSIKPVVSLSIEKPIEVKGGCSVRPKNRLSPSISAAQSALWDGRREIEYWEEDKKSLKRFADQNSFDESFTNRSKRRRSNSSGTGSTPCCDSLMGEKLSVSQLGGGSFWFPQIPGVTDLDPSLKEEQISFAPRNPLIGSMAPVITNKGENEVGTSHGGRPKEEDSGSSTGSEDHGRIQRVDESSYVFETGNGSQMPYPSEGTRVITNVEVQLEHQELEMVSLVVACVESISSKNFSAILPFLSKLGDLASPQGSVIHRVIAYFTEALALRVSRLWPRMFHIATPWEIERPGEEVNSAVQLFNYVSPIQKFLHFTANEMLVRAFEGKERVHIIDFDIKQGLQWSGFLHSLASRPNPPSHVRITGIGESKRDLQETGDILAGFAATLNLNFDFHVVVDRLEDVRLWMLHVKENETVAVNCLLQLHKMLYDETGGALRDFLSLIRSTYPTVVIVAEQEAEHEDPSLEVRVSNSLKYYSAIFDSIGSSLSLTSSIRVKIEEMFAKEIRNIIACEGIDRFERHQRFTKWRNLMENEGFKCKGLGEKEMPQAKMLLKMYPKKKFDVEKSGEDGAGITLSYLDQPLYTVSAWTPLDVPGSSSSVTQPI